MWIRIKQTDGPNISLPLPLGLLKSRLIWRIAEKHGGGGHAHASGATAHSKEEMNTIISEADELIKNFKIKNEDLI